MDQEQVEAVQKESTCVASVDQSEAISEEPTINNEEEAPLAPESLQAAEQIESENVEPKIEQETPPSIQEESSTDSVQDRNPVQQPPQWSVQQPPQWSTPQPPQWGTQQPAYQRRPSYENGYYPNGPYAVPQWNPNHRASYAPYGQMPPQPLYYPPAKPKKENNSISIIALVCSLVGVLLLNYLPFMGMILGIISICFGAIGFRRSKYIGRGKVCSVIGLMFGILELIISVAMLVTLLVLSIRLMGEASDAVRGFVK